MLSFVNGYRNQSDNKTLLPIVDIRVSTTSLPCVDHDSRPKRASEKTYPVIRHLEEGCGRYGVKTAYTKQIDTFSEEYFLSNNNLTDSVLNLFPGFRDFIKNESDILYIEYKIPVRESFFC